MFISLKMNGNSENEPGKKKIVNWTSCTAVPSKNGLCNSKWLFHKLHICQTAIHLLSIKIYAVC